jgi:RNA polymerase sigma-70 factor (ECF subfamily)
LDVAQLFNQYKDMVYNLALHYVQNREEAEEICQDVFVNVHFAKDNFRNEASIKTWIYRITINKSLDYLKAKKTKKRWAAILSLDFFQDHAIASKEVQHPGMVLEQKEALQLIFNCLNQLPNHQKTIIILSKIEQKTIKEIADILNLSTKSVESHMHRAKKNLGQLLQQEGRI